MWQWAIIYAEVCSEFTTVLFLADSWRLVVKRSKERIAKN